MKMKTIPSNANLVHHGPIFKIYQREQEMFDGSYKTFEIAQRNDVVKVLLIENNEIIMIYDEQPGYSGSIELVWWIVESNENLEIAVKREVLEEIWYTIGHLEQRFSMPYRNKMIWNRYYYIARDIKRVQDPQFDQWGERITIVRKDFDQFLDYVLADDTFPDFSYYIMKHYIIPHKQEELKKMLFV